MTHSHFHHIITIILIVLTGLLAGLLITSGNHRIIQITLGLIACYGIGELILGYKDQPATPSLLTMVKGLGLISLLLIAWY